MTASLDRLRADGLRLSYGGEPVVDGVDLALQRAGSRPSAAASAERHLPDGSSRRRPSRARPATRTAVAGALVLPRPKSVDDAIEQTNLIELRDRLVDHLSPGGQRQRACIAMALAQRSATVLLDEPTTYLDLAHQIEVPDLLTH